MQQDILIIKQPLTLPNGEVISGYTPIEGLDAIDAIYSLDQGVLSVEDHGVLNSQAGDHATLCAQAPSHALVNGKVFDGAIKLVDHDVDLSFVKNKLEV